MMPPYLIVDAHEDLAWNMQTYGRDYTLSAHATRHREAGGIAPQTNGECLLGWPDYQRGRVEVIFATIFAAPIRRCEGAWDILCYRSPAEAHQMYRSQLDAYIRLLEDHPDKFRLITGRTGLETHLAEWEHFKPGTESEFGPPVGLVLLMEGAEGVRAPDELEQWWQWGLRLIGPAWAGTRFCGGTREPGPLTQEGYALLEAMAQYGFTLDLSHMDEKAALQALDFYPGSIVVTHGNPLGMLKEAPSNRHVSDQVLQGVIERGGVIGIVPYNLFLDASWRKGDRRALVSLDRVAAHIDYVCQVAGDARHVGLGSDFDGGLGLQHVPPEIDTIADLQKLAPFLLERGYAEADIAAVFGGNWLERLKKDLPADE